MSRHTQTGRDATEAEIREAERILSLTPIQQRNHPSAVPADLSKLSHVNTYCSLPEFYLDKLFTCRKCGKREIWKARDQKWYYEEAKGHIDARAIECHDCRTATKTVSMTLRKVESSDLETFYQHQLDPQAIRMAAFVSKDRKDKAVFDAHWKKILSSPQNRNRTIVADGQVAGYIACYPNGENIEVTYWLGREFWGKGLATQALTRMLDLVVERPIFARAATDNIGSIRVLQKCGFKIIGKDKGFANGRGEETEEYILRLDPDLANE